MPIEHGALLDQARELARIDQAGKPREVNLRRAVSNVYYALFHYLTEHGTQWMIGTANDRRPYRDVLSRAFEHAEMAEACRSFAGGTLPQAAQPEGTLQTVPEAIRHLADTFVDAQEKRHLADYDRTARFVRADVLVLIRQAERAIEQFDAIGRSAEAGFFLSCILVWKRIKRRG